MKNLCAIEWCPNTVSEKGEVCFFHSCNQHTKKTTSCSAPVEDAGFDWHYSGNILESDRVKYIEGERWVNGEVYDSLLAKVKTALTVPVGVREYVERAHNMLNGDTDPDDILLAKKYLKEALQKLPMELVCRAK